MIKYLMRKTIYKEADQESRDMFLRLNYPKYIIKLLCWMMWAVIFSLPMIPLLIIDLCEDVQFALSTQLFVVAFFIIELLGIVLILKFFGVAILIIDLCEEVEFTLRTLLSIATFLLVTLLGVVLILNFFYESLFVCTILIAEKVYFLVYTIKGKALSRKDFETIKNKNKELYEFVSSSNCRGYCYSICFDMLKVLKRGCIEFVAVKKLSTQKDDEDDDGKNFTMHVLYVNNGWAFDTYSQRQYPIEELHTIYKAITYRSFNYDEIKNKSYDDFRSENELQLTKWCNMNDCTTFFRE